MFFKIFLLVPMKLLFWRGDWALGYHFMGFRHFRYIFHFSKILSLFSCVGTKAPPAAKMPWGKVENAVCWPRFEVVQQLLSQRVSTSLIVVITLQFHLWWKKNLLNHQKVWKWTWLRIRVCVSSSCRASHLHGMMPRIH